MLGVVMMEKKPHIEIKKSGHIVILDQNWHSLFTGKKPYKIKVLEIQLNKLMKEQGKVNSEYKAYKAIKKKMMDEIIQGMTVAFDDQKAEGTKNLKKKQKNIQEINAKFDNYEKRKLELPHEIEKVNQVLLKESMIIFYERMIHHKEKKRRLESEIQILHEKVKELVGKKEDLEEENAKLYAFMHDIAGLEVIEQLDTHYFGGGE
jgi:chromosome segregation ATPase